MDPALKELMEGGAEDEVEAIIHLDPEGGVPPHVRVVARFGEIATVRLPRERIAETWADESVVSLKAPRPFGLDPDPLPAAAESAAEGVEEETDDARRPEDLDATGRGAVVAVLDWGFDFAHPNFRRRDGSTRALALWDQSAPGSGPEPYGYGRVYSREAIDRALRSDEPYRALGYHPAAGDPTGRGAHGTHVLDIAAGNGRAEGAPLGVAPEADLLFVHLATPGTGSRANLGNSVTLLEALDWVAHQAGERPWVVNLSVGRHGGPHTGLTLVERGIDALLAAAPGRAVVQSTGNYYAARVHASGYLRPGREHTLHWCTDQADLTPNELEVWYPGQDVFAVEMRSPDGETEVRAPLGGQASIEVAGREVGRLYHRAKDPSNGDNHIDVFLYPQAPAGCWQVILIGEEVTDGRFHAWVERDAGCPSCQSRLDPGDADPTTTTGTIANGFRSITVGAYDAHTPDRPLGVFSSCGPTRDGRLKPDLLAPGVRVLAARSASLELGSDTPLLTRYSGTSMAAPHVTGTVALMFEVAARPLTIQETRKLLLSTAREARLEGEPAPRLGSGYLDAERAVEAARSFATPPHPESAEAEPVSESFPEIVEQAAQEPEPALLGPAEQEEPMHREHRCACGTPREWDEGREAQPHELATEAPPEPYAESVWQSEPEAEPAEAFAPVWDPAAELLELADDVAGDGAGASLLDRVLARAESAGSAEAGFAESWWGPSLSPATVFDSVIAGGAPRRQLEAAFEILAVPGEAPRAPLAAGDLLVRRGLGEGGVGHAAMVAAGETWAAEDLAGAGLAGETARPGGYVHVVEGGFQPHGRSEGFARLALDPAGRLPFDQVLLRPRTVLPAAPLPAAAAAGTLAQPDLSTACPGPPTVLADFDSDRATLKAAHRTSIIGLAQTIADSQDTTTPVHTVCIVGHTDSQGGDAYNVDLGRRRAASVQSELIFRIDRLRTGLSARLTFQPSSLGESSPVGDNNTAAGRAANRRVEVFLNRRWQTFCLTPPVAADDPTALNLHAVGDRNFDGGTVTLFGAERRLRGNVFYPADAAGHDRPFKSGLGPVPIVFLLHGNHATLHDPHDRNNEFCPQDGPFPFTPVTIPNFRGYEYFQRLLARMGVISVSVDCNETNCDDGLGPASSNIHFRAALLRAVVRHFQRLHSTASPFRGKIDFSKVGFFGHSRGGEAVLVAAETIPQLSDLAGVTILGVFSLAPTDTTASSGQPSGFAFTTLLPAADGDVRANSGARFYDQAIPNPFKCQLYIDGANHNFFNTQWPRNDGRGAPILTAPQHRDLLSAYGCAFFRHVLLGHATLRFLRGDELPPGVPAANVHLSFEQAAAVTVDDHENRNVLINALGRPSGANAGMTAQELDLVAQSPRAFPNAFGNTVGLVLRSTSRTARFRSELAAPTDLTGKEVWIRAAEVFDGVAVPAGGTGYLIGLEDAAGRIALADSDSAGGVPRPWSRELAFTKTMLTTQRFPAGCFVGNRFDMTRVRAVVLRLNRGDGRAIALDQLQVV